MRLYLQRCITVKHTQNLSQLPMKMRKSNKYVRINTSVEITFGLFRNRELVQA